MKTTISGVFMRNKKISGFFHNHRKESLLALLFLLLLAFTGTVFIGRQKKSETSFCGNKSCLTGCCVKNKCIPKDVAIADYTCLGEGKWQQPDGKVANGFPDEVEDEVSKADQMPQQINSIDSKKAMETASNIVKWLDTMKNDKGQYYTGLNCSGDGACSEPEPIDKQIGINVVWAKYRNYINSKNDNDLKSLEKDLTVLTTPEIGFPAQNDFYNCKLMYEMNQSGLFKEKVKDNIDVVCIGSVHYGPEMDEFVSTLSQNKYDEELMIKEVMEGATVDKWEISNSKKFNKYAIYAADIANYYRWIGIKDDLRAAKYYFNLALQIFSDKSTSSDGSVIGLAALDLYKATSEQKYLDFMNFFFDYKAKEGCKSLEDCAYFLMFLDELYKETNNSKAKNEAGKVIQFLINDYFDSDKGIFYSSRLSHNYPVLENSILAGIFAKYN